MQFTVTTLNTNTSQEVHASSAERAARKVFGIYIYMAPDDRNQVRNASGAVIGEVVQTPHSVV